MDVPGNPRMKSSLYIVIIGCGRLGAHLATRISRDNHSVVTIDCNEHAFDKLPAEYGGFKVEGDATELAVLRQAKMDKADLTIATTRSDNINLMVAQVAKVEFNVPRVLARVFDPARKAVYRQLEVETICPTIIAADQFLKFTEQEGAS